MACNSLGYGLTDRYLIGCNLHKGLIIHNSLKHKVDKFEVSPQLGSLDDRWQPDSWDNCCSHFPQTSFKLISVQYLKQKKTRVEVYRPMLVSQYAAKYYNKL
ncbi:hypothetical protein MAR_020904 [Mya arenaria]|uniref:Uncharacterized protein n=1 Tax=Mya arenaria TaxID=6604 RepID=A0ABY7E6P3_MYAAR|nr:hypothetical protein MAR_020904 [Mya arenaria]